MLKASVNTVTRESRATFIIAGIRLNLDAISRKLDLTPTHTHHIGDLNELGKPYLHDMWLLDSPLNESEPLDTHLKWLARQLKPHYDFIQSLKGSAEIYIYCGYDSNSDQGGFSLSAEALVIFTELNIPMEVTVLLAGE